MVFFLSLASTVSFCVMQESVDDQERQRYNQLIEAAGWFFFDLFILGYVEDPITGCSFRFPGGMKWAIYIEVCVCVHVRACVCLYVCIHVYALRI